MSETTLTVTRPLPEALRALADLIDAPSVLEQTRFSFYKYNDEGTIIAACGIGKASLKYLDPERALALSVTDTCAISQEVYNQVGIDSIAMIKHPTRDIGYYVSNVIMDLNDHEGWTFEQIATYLRSEAARLEQEALAPVAN